MLQLCLGARLLFIGLITQADDDGRLKADPRLVRAAIFPYDDDITADQIDEWLADLMRAGLVTVYTVDDFQYAHLRGWANQKIDKPSPSDLPAPPTTSTPSGDDSPNVRRSIDESSTKGDAASGKPAPEAAPTQFAERSTNDRARAGARAPADRIGSGSDLEEISTHSARARELMQVPEFVEAIEELWSNWPSARRDLDAARIVEKVAALGVDEVAGARHLLAAADEDSRGKDWREGFIPKISKWLDQRQWDRPLANAGDEVAETAGKYLQMIPGGAR